MQLPHPVLILDLLPDERTRLLELLSELTAEQWRRPTACAGWTVKDIAAHLLADDLGRLSRQRDGFRAAEPAPEQSVLELVNTLNAEWVRALRHLSPGVLLDLLRQSGRQTRAFFATLDPFALNGVVSWAGPQPAPVWLDLAREYTERWHHQQHIREAVGAALMEEPRYLAPVLATFVHALPHTYRDIAAPVGTTVQLRIEGPSGSDWAVVREGHGWALYQGTAEAPAAVVSLPERAAWRLFTRLFSPEEAEAATRLEGDDGLATPLWTAVAIIA